MSREQTHTRDGSVYLITLITVAAIVSMILIGVRLRTASNDESALIEQMAHTSSGILDATEYALQVISTDGRWNKTAQGGVVYNKFVVGDSVYSSTVLDASTGIVATDTTTNYLVSVHSESGITRSDAQLEVVSNTVNYTAAVEALGAIHYWPMNESTNDRVALDLVGSYPGDYMDPAIAGTGANDEGAQVPVFADASDHIEIPWGKDFEQSNGTLCVWMKLTDTGVLSSNSVFGIEYKTGGSPTLSLTTFGTTISAYISEGGSYDIRNFSTTPSDSFEPNTWHHITMVWGSKGLFVYVDGVQKGYINVTEGTGTARANKGGEQPLHIGGGYMMSPSSQPEDGFNGSLAHAVYFGDQLDSAQVAELAAIKPDLSTLSIVDDSWIRVFK